MFKLLPSLKILHHMTIQDCMGSKNSTYNPWVSFDPDIVVQLFFNTLKGTICLVRVLDDKLSLKLILELPNEFCEKIERVH